MNKLDVFLILFIFIILTIGGSFFFDNKTNKTPKDKILYGVTIHDTSLSAKIIELDSIRYIILHEERIK